MKSEKIGFLIPDSIDIYQHVSGSRTEELRKDADFGQRVGSQREVEFTLEGKEGPQWHVHSGMQETFKPLNGQVTVFLITQVDDDLGPMVYKYILEPNDTLEVVPDTPHLICNEGDNSVTVNALQTITTPGRQTVAFDLTGHRKQHQDK